MKTSRSDTPLMFASLRLTGPSLVPTEVTKFLGVHPTFAYRIGEEYIDRRSGEKFFRKTGLWLLSTENKKYMSSVEDHIKYIEEIIYKNRKEWWPDKKLFGLSDFITRHDFHLTVSLFWHGFSGSALPEIDTTFADRITAIGGIFESDFETDETSYAA